ncbi:glycoside hydrolase family 105 protein [Cystobasidium minutum MCA 4210]|uniref:glycoside hydrolase family 105 protein n=1 Tax=Cystobasidium minutum MCA 4210 TaxID=1397322 RepID=UPI0034CDF710|eukprot:jgi/Rhomi1/170484/fgenesh1_kg.4_\
MHSWSPTLFFAVASFLMSSSISKASNAEDTATTEPYSIRMAKSLISRGQGIVDNEADTSIWLQAGFTQKAFKAILAEYKDSKDTSAVSDYLLQSSISAAGPLSNATANLKRSLDRHSNGNSFIAFYESTGNDTFKAGIEGLKRALDLQPRNGEGGIQYFVYPYWSYLDGMYSFAPFYTLYGTQYSPDNKTAVLKDVILQMDLLYKYTFDNATKLLVHGYDYSKTAVWANPETGASPWVWGRSMGWYHMALVDTLELFPKGAEGYDSLLQKFKQLSKAVVANADPETGAWHQIIGQPDREGNYVESSGSAMFAYALLKGVRKGYLTSKKRNVLELESTERDSKSINYVAAASKAYEHIVNTFVVDNNNGTLSYNGTVAVCSLNSTATYEYYVGRPILYDSVLGSNAFILASVEYERLHS